jgi:hypothetical protein
MGGMLSNLAPSDDVSVRDKDNYVPDKFPLDPQNENYDA